MRNKDISIDANFGRSRSWSDLDGTNMRTGTIVAQSGHQTWSGDGEYWLLGNQQLIGRKWDENYPSNVHILSHGRTSDPGECGHSGRWITNAGGVLDLRTGGSWESTM